MNNLEKPGTLSVEMLTAINRILDTSPNIVFGGSISLVGMNLIDRPIGDIDLVFKLNTSFSPSERFSEASTRNVFNLFDRMKSEYIAKHGPSDDVWIGSETSTDVNDKTVCRIGYKIGNVKICCFKVDDEELSSSEITLFGRKMRIQHVNHALNAKRLYKDTQGKHARDMQSINEEIDLIF